MFRLNSALAVYVHRDPVDFRKRVNGLVAIVEQSQLGPERLLYELTKPGPGGASSLLLTPVELIDRIAALVPPPRLHRHRYFGVLAPNSPLRAAVTALALATWTLESRTDQLLRYALGKKATSLSPPLLRTPNAPATSPSAPSTVATHCLHPR